MKKLFILLSIIGLAFCFSPIDENYYTVTTSIYSLTADQDAYYIFQPRGDMWLSLTGKTPTQCMGISANVLVDTQQRTFKGTTLKLYSGTTTDVYVERYSQ